MINKFPAIPKHIRFVHILILCKDESTYAEAVFGHDGFFRWGYDEPVIEDVESWLPMPMRSGAPMDTKPCAWMSECIKGPGIGSIEQSDGPGSTKNMEYWTQDFPVYRKPHAETVALPGEATADDFGDESMANGWNACLDKIREMNK